MTISEFVKRKMHMGLIALITCWLFTGIFGMPLMIETMNKNHHSLLPFFIFPPFILIALFLIYGIRCPKCGSNLGNTIGRAFINPFIKFKPTCCPFCAISLDEDYASNKKKEEL